MERSLGKKAAMMVVLLSAITLPAWGRPNKNIAVPEGGSWPAYVIPSGVLIFGGVILARRIRTNA